MRGQINIHARSTTQYASTSFAAMSDTSSPSLETESATGLIARLQEIAEQAPEDGITLAEFIEKLSERAFGVVLFALALPVCIPFLYGIPQVIAVPMLVLAGQMVAGFNEPWLPEKFAQRRLGKAGLTRMARWGKRWFGWMEALARPRLLFMSGPTGERVVGTFFCLFCASILVPLPLTNSAPGVAIVVASLGLITRDGILILLGTLWGLAWIAMLAIGGPALIYAIVDALRGLVGGGG